VHDEILEITTAVGCKQTCDYCPQRTVVAQYGPVDRIMSWETYLRCLHNVPRYVEIGFAGFTEPWQNELCTEMVLHAAETGHAVNVFTTCIGMSPEDVESLKHLKFHHFCVHLPDDAGRMHFNSYHIENYLKTVKAVIETIPNHTLMCIGKVHRLIRNLTDARDWTGDLHSRAGSLTEVGEQIHKTGPLFCTAHPKLKHNVLMPNGEVVLCCMDYGLRHCFGNLLQTPYEDLFTGDEYLKVRLRLSNDGGDVICRKCYIASPI